MSGIAAVTVLGVVSAVLGALSPGGATAAVRIDLYSEPLCPGLGLLTSSSIEGLVTGRGVADIVDLRLHPLGHCVITPPASAKSNYSCACPRPNEAAECALAQYMACAMGSSSSSSSSSSSDGRSNGGWASQHGYWPFVRCLERLANGEDSDHGLALSVQNVSRYAEVCAQATQAWRPGGWNRLLTNCTQQQQTWYKWLHEDSVDAAAHLDPVVVVGGDLSSVQTPAVMVEGEALSLTASVANTLDALLSRVCFKWGTSSLPDGCNNRLLAVDYTDKLCNGK